MEWCYCCGPSSQEKLWQQYQTPSEESSQPHSDHRLQNNIEIEKIHISYTETWKGRHYEEKSIKKIKNPRHSIRFICSPFLITRWPDRARFYICEIRMTEWKPFYWRAQFVYFSIDILINKYPLRELYELKWHFYFYSVDFAVRSRPNRNIE